MTASFLRASLFTSVVSFGVAFFAFGVGVILILVGWALRRVEQVLRAPCGAELGAVVVGLTRTGSAPIRPRCQPFLIAPFTASSTSGVISVMP